MKTALLLLFFTVECKTIKGADVIQQEWLNFQKLFRRNYDAPGESDKRFSIFKENLLKISSHNDLYDAGNVTHKLGVNQFADWTAEEFAAYVNKFQINTTKIDAKIYQSGEKNPAIPDSCDWRLQWAVTDVRNQGHCGSCWAFSAAGALEGQAQIALGKRLRLSEQNLVDCADESYGNYGCNGGDSNAAFLYVKSSGIQSEETYPYVATQGECRQKSAELYVDDFYFVGGTEEALKEAVASLGPVSVAIESTTELQHYTEGVFFDRTCTNRLNHGVLAVGYGAENGQDYWLIKNSWGSSWGEQGYFRMVRNMYNNCGIASYATVPVVSERKRSD
ncbi:procathepsin L-like [Coccinella septempunctata]|uniref:procathepsin L-like n=1 Tax=Coccinella septempunctata TaxID=41139 RepID=UPI001D073AD3|nr:procathepsin L-like [Coccinella septempunctata]